MSEHQDSILKRLANKIKFYCDMKKVKYIIIIILCLIVCLIFFSSFTSSNKSIKSQTTIQENSSWQEYCQSQEHRLEYVLESIKGVGSVKVFIMVDESPTITYLENTTKNTNSNSLESFQTVAVEIKNGTITNPGVVVETLPKILGVLVVAGGVSDIKLKNTLANVVSSVMKVNLANVEVLEGK